ncbi:MAG: hypothetical protein PWP24_1969 [Clostridiales bacterium]|nr:hypothetical protein [Clostridiales bacterium]
MSKRNIITYLIGGAAGILAGYLYYAKIGCLSGSCPITSNPLHSSIYGLIIGLLLASVFTESKK